MNKHPNKIISIYKKLYNAFGPQYWWPGASSFEVMIGAILTQNTNWQNVEKAILNLKKARSLNFEKMYKMSEGRLSRLIRPAGYYNIKARRLKNFLRFVKENYSGSIEKMKKADTFKLRKGLLSVSGIGSETADSMLLYALNKPVFVVDAYTKRIAARHNISKADAEYEAVQELFLRHLPRDRKLYNEYHALLVKLGQEFCGKTKIECERCPINEKN
ncbi:MAG TPA: endonuclease III domain-containing protein [Candidatus Omnitrophota bacterium]|nr:endonuclease III domain-containing protein [Candidatus Omnitrophota bacterium]